MSNQQVLEKAIQKAIDGGWTKPVPTDALGLTYVYEDCVEKLIFNHEFAKALWGEREFEYQDDGDGVEGLKVANPGWKHYLQEMVIAEDPIKYLGDNL